MIRYALACAEGHEFESWFQNSAAFDKQKKRGLVTCPACGSAKVEKAIMAPRLARSDSEEIAPPVPVPPAMPASPQPASAMPPMPVPAGKSAVAMTSPQERELRNKLK
jgi:hypothetical protein